MAIPLGITAFCTIHPYALEHPVDIKAIDACIGRRAPSALAHLTRAVYVPWHRDTTTHLPLYNISSEYHRTIRDAQVGGSEFKTRLCLMRKPTGRPGQGDVGFLVDMDTQGSWVAVSERKLGMGEEAVLSMPTTVEDDAAIQHDTLTYSMPPPTFPLPSKRTASGLCTHPHFTLTGAPRPLEWQIHPVELGGLCYVLVDTSVPGGMFAGDDTIVAVYHHAHFEAALPKRYSEGVLLLHGQPDVEDTVVVASLMRVLRYVRRDEKKEKKKESRW
ncbi:uncharacterized protein F5Z01DRAFT_687213 [Emericellopsis atlantica]|uniref:Uncharacterized protein n=1 Tax=Emericellopsis atlantica TaxID=2614577 RepID=A0A9P8CP48_9HYPO|nr:uncharacterized protein F5Z01DRAFT_687213 [Emericellopsis atlantica]KAG9254459.1 hypothetical protein F5Z01DRAFT_687213 [Emericellopsis atlantica]